MHAIERPHLQRVGVMALGGVLLAIVVLLLAASRVGDIGIGSGASSSARVIGPATAIHRTSPGASSWLASPFASPFRVVLPWMTATRR